jgi:hypothetical protein
VIKASPKAYTGFMDKVIWRVSGMVISRRRAKK